MPNLNFAEALYNNNIHTYNDNINSKVASNSSRTLSRSVEFGVLHRTPTGGYSICSCYLRQRCYFVGCSKTRL